MDDTRGDAASPIDAASLIDAASPVDAASPIDAALPVDAFRPPAREGWTWVDGLPAGCNAFIADDPATAGRLEWTACLEARDTCRALVPAETPRGSRYLRIEGLQWDAARGEATFVWWWEVESAERDYVVSDTAGRTYAVWKLVNHSPSNRCDPTTFGTGAGRWAMTLSAQNGRGGHLLFAGALEDAGRLRQIATLTSEELGGSFVQELEVTGHALGASTARGSRAWRFEWDGTFRRIETAPGTGLYLRDAHEDALLLSEDGDTGRVLVADAAGQRVLIDARPDGKAGFPRGDGEILVWQQAHGPVGVSEFERVELWASPYATEATRLEPRHLATLPVTVVQSSAALTNGYVTVPQAGADELAVYAVDGSQEARLRAPEGTMFHRSIVTESELVVFLGLSADRHVRRIEMHRLDALETR